MAEKWESHIRWEMAVWHGVEGYGGYWTFDTEVEAIKERAYMMSHGYKEIHVRKVVVEVLTETIQSET
jgi:hypothetical protein